MVECQLNGTVWRNCVSLVVRNVVGEKRHDLSFLRRELRMMINLPWCWVALATGNLTSRLRVTSGDLLCPSLVQVSGQVSFASRRGVYKAMR